MNQPLVFQNFCLCPSKGLPLESRTGNNHRQAGIRHTQKVRKLTLEHTRRSFPLEQGERETINTND
ncbi:MAG: hypothetical protein M3Q07_11165 [Pseudobdellovibrionaceae bacterium]|nr:hypothetical protein [Pseudobdellovibrionaceae bacterium]